MTTFSGAYLQEPTDFTSVANEATLIAVADDPSAPVIPAGALAWSQLTVGEAAALVATLNPIIASKEGIVNGYLRAGGYLVPTNLALNPVVREYAAKLVWNALRYRKAMLNDEELAAADGSVLRELRDVANGIALLVGEDVAIEPASATVYAIGTAVRVFSRSTLEDM